MQVYRIRRIRIPASPMSKSITPWNGRPQKCSIHQHHHSQYTILVCMFPLQLGKRLLRVNMLHCSGANLPQASLAPAPNFRFPIRHQFQTPSFPTVRGQQNTNQSSPFRGSNSTTQRPRPKFQNHQYMGFRQNTN